MTTPSSSAGLAALFMAASVAASLPARPGQAETSMPITLVDRITVGHHTLDARPTGCTVILAGDGAVGAVDVRGGAPGTRETDLLAPDNVVDEVHAIVLAGGSAFGLDAASGVVRYLAERGIGFKTAGGPVPIVPAAILFDLTVGGQPDVRPDAACGYEAARTASSGAVAEGSVGAGAGATVGKLLGRHRAMRGGLGTAATRTPEGLVVGALVAVNAVGTVVDPRTGRPVAGVRTADGLGLEDPFALVRRGGAPRSPWRENTTIGVVATNARLTKAEAHRVAMMAHAGIARAVVPSHLPADGDALFALATGTLGRDTDVSIVGALAAEMVSDAILRGVRLATSLPGLPGARDLR